MRSTQAAAAARSPASSLRLLQSDRHARRLFHGLEDDGRPRRSDPRYAAEPMPQQLADVLGVAGAHLEQIAVVAGDVMDLQDLGTLRQRERDAVFAGRLL